MSQTQKEERQSLKTKSIVKWSAIFIVIVLIAAFIAYQLFYKKIEAENFVPENPTSLMLIDINPDSEQNLSLDKLAMNLGNENIFSDYLEGQFFQGISPENLKLDTQDLKSWLGDKLVISKIKLSNLEDRSAHIVEVKNIEKAKEVLGAINENIKKKGSVVTNEEFRHIGINFIEGENNVAYALYDNFLLVSEDPAGIKMMIDTRTGRNKSLLSDKVYKKLRKKLKADDFVVFTFIDVISTLKYISGLSPQIDFSFIDRVASSGRINVGAVFTAKENGVEANILLGGSGDSYEKKKGFKPNLAEKIPADVSFYIEGQDIKSFTERLIVGGMGDNLSDEDLQAKSELLKKGINLQFGVDLEKDLFSLLTGRYAFMLFPEKEGKGYSVGIILESSNKEETAEKMKKIEEIVADQINKNIIKDEKKQVAFYDREYKNFKYRFAKLPEDIKLDIYYAVLEDEIIITSTKDALTKLLDSSRENADNILADSQDFQDTYTEIESKDATRLIYVDMDKTFRFFDNFEILKYTKVQDELRSLNNMGFLNKYSGEGGWAQGFISVKQDD